MKIFYGGYWYTVTLQRDLYNLRWDVINPETGTHRQSMDDVVSSNYFDYLAKTLFAAWREDINKQLRENGMFQEIEQVTNALFHMRRVK